MNQKLREKVVAYKNTWKEMSLVEKIFMLAMIVVGTAMIVSGGSMVCNS